MPQLSHRLGSVAVGVLLAALGIVDAAAQTTEPEPKQDPPAAKTAPQEEPKEPARKKDEPDPDDPLADRYGDADDEEMQDDEDLLDEPVDDLEALQEPGQFEQWLKLGNLKIRNRIEWRYRRFTSKGFIDGLDMTVPRGTERDQEFRDWFEIETYGIGAENVNSYVSFDYRKDIDGTRDPSFHKSIVTAYDDHELIRLHSAWVEATGVADILRVRLGRQSTHEAHPVTFDGASSRIDRVRLFGAPAEFRAFVGAIVSDFSNLRKEVVFGGGMTVRPSSNLALELRDTRYTRNRLEAEVRWSPAPDVTLMAMYGFYDAKGRDSRFEAGYTIPGLRTEMTAGFYSRYSHDFRLDFVTGQPSTNHRRDYLYLPELAPSRELYLRIDQPVAQGLGIGGEFIRHTLRRRSDESPYDTDFNQINAYADAEYGPLRLRTEVRYYHADREKFVLLVPRLPFPTVPASIRQGERDHIEYHLNTTATLAPGWSVYAGMVWNRVNYVDALASVKHEQYADARLELNAQLTKRVTLRVSYEHTRDAEYFSPYFERFQALTWVLDVRM